MTAYKLLMDNKARRRYFLGLLFSSVLTAGSAQPPEDTTSAMLFANYLRYADFHIHPTYKHYFRYKSAKEMREFLGAVRLDSGNNLIGIDPAVVKKYQYINWQKYKKTKDRAVRKGLTSTLRNYDQSSYPEIMYVPGSVLCNSYSPYEKQFALKGFKRLVSHFVVTGMGLRRLKAYGKDSHTPLNDFLSEYYYNLIQEEEALVETHSPGRLYRQEGNAYQVNPAYFNRIKMVRDAAELDSILRANDQAFASWLSPGQVPHLITPMVMSIEGAQVLYGNLSGQEKYILNPLNIKGKNKRFFAKACPARLQQIRGELLDNAVYIKNLPHRLFFITLGHFAQNHVVGFAKTLDRDPENVQHRSVSTITTFSGARNDILRKTYDGFNPGCEKTLDDCQPDSLGFKIAEAFLNPNNTKYGKPTYIDVKHMDIKGRIQYYYMRRKWEQKYSVPIPIVASHFAVSGEKQAMAAATGLRPNFDRYGEVEHVEDYYQEVILKNDDDSARRTYWRETMLGDNYRLLNDKPQKLDAFEMGMYKPLDFRNGGEHFFVSEPFDPFERYVPDSNKVGWFYPWSINLFDEEIIEINKSDGIIGLLLDPRQLGAYMPKYKHFPAKVGQRVRELQDSLKTLSLAMYGLKPSDLSEIEYFKAEPLLRNIFYIVQTIQLQQAAEKYFKASGYDTLKTQGAFPGFIPDDLYCLKDAWQTVSIGGDFDGLIDPIDFSPTAAYIPLLRKKLVAYAYIFAQVHKEFRDPLTSAPLITSLEDSDIKMQLFFYANLKGFISKYF